MALTAKMLNVARVMARFRAIPESVKVAVGTELANQVEGLTVAIRINTPINELDPHPGALRDSVHFFANRDRPLSYKIIADAKDEKGNFIGPHVEHGHQARDGSHVPRVPFFFPTYRSRKKSMRRKLNAAGRKAAKTAFEG